VCVEAGTGNWDGGFGKGKTENSPLLHKEEGESEKPRTKSDLSVKNKNLFQNHKEETQRGPLSLNSIWGKSVGRGEQ